MVLGVERLGKRKQLVFAALAGLLAAAPASAGQCDRGVVIGRVSYVRDGDTIELGEMAIRLQGLAAPERNEPGGTESRRR